MVNVDLGKLNFHPTEKDHIFVESNNVMCRKIGYQVNAHYYRWKDGKFHLGQEDKDHWRQRQSLYIHRNDWRLNVSEPARKSILTALNGVVDTWVQNNGEALNIAQSVHVETAISNREALIKEANRVIRALKSEIMKLKNGMHLDQHTSVQFNRYPG